MIILQAPPVTLPSVNTASVQTASNMIFMVLVGLIAGGLVLFVLYKIYQRMTYKYRVTVIEKVGKGEIEYTTYAKQITDADKNILIDYLGVGQSSKWDNFADYLRSVKIKTFGLIPGSVKGFSVYKIGEKIIPLKVDSNPGFVPVDYDMFNYMQYRVRANIAKYTRENKLMQLLPIIGLGMVVLAFVLGSLFWGKHVEAVATKILSVAAEQSTKILEAGGALQVIPGNT